MYPFLFPSAVKRGGYFSSGHVSLPGLNLVTDSLSRARLWD